tara:strand:- start:14302 stop:14772 length:471 start_codon:yes stop_codon:yes gene_type:complete
MLSKYYQSKNLMNYNVISPENNQDFNRYYYFRWKYLRKPLNQELGSEKDEIEIQSIHRMILDNQKEIIAVGRIHYNTSIESQIRYFAVDKSYRRQGVGSYLMQDLENIAIKNNCTSMILNARENAVVFYEKLGYKIIKKTNLLFGKIQHYEMKKVL